MKKFILFLGLLGLTTSTTSCLTPIIIDTSNEIKASKTVKRLASQSQKPKSTVEMEALTIKQYDADIETLKKAINSILLTEGNGRVRYIYNEKGKRIGYYSYDYSMKRVEHNLTEVKTLIDITITHKIIGEDSGRKTLRSFNKAHYEEWHNKIVAQLERYKIYNK